MDPGPDGFALFLVGLIRIRIQEAKIVIHKNIKAKKFHVLKCWILFFRAESFPVAWTSFADA
jgi:hypothetical protein